jgi:hypothetical protein
MARLFEVHPGGWPRYRMLTKWERFRQRLREAWWILNDEYRLHRAWQAGYDRGRNDEYKRLIINKAYLSEASVFAPGRPE